jgi:hypothetical protein
MNWYVNSCQTAPRVTLSGDKGRKLAAIGSFARSEQPMIAIASLAPVPVGFNQAGRLTRAVGIGVVLSLGHDLCR